MSGFKGLWLCLATVAALGLLFGGSGVALAGAGQAVAAPAPTSTRPPLPTSTPPAPTPTPIPAAPSRALEGGTIELRVHLPGDWPWGAVPWQELWTVVQWQDRAGDWRDVTGWQGQLDTVVVGAQEVVGIKTWWVARADLGKGPFRWTIQQGKGGKQVAVSSSFYLPGAAGATSRVDVAVDPKGLDR